MPYRAIMITLVTVTLALLAAALWVRSISPLLVEVNASTQPSAQPGNFHPGLPATAPADTERPDKQFKALVRAVGIATLLIVVALFVIGFFTTLRAWMRTGKHKKTRYVDAWKIAGERMQAKKDDQGPPDLMSEHQ